MKMGSCFRKSELTKKQQEKAVADFIYLLCRSQFHSEFHGEIHFALANAKLSLYRYKLQKSFLTIEFVKFVENIPIKFFKENENSDIEKYLFDAWNRLKAAPE